jgi:hypothetical protein
MLPCLHDVIQEQLAEILDLLDGLVDVKLIDDHLYDIDLIVHLPCHPYIENFDLLLLSLSTFLPLILTYFSQSHDSLEPISTQRQVIPQVMNGLVPCLRTGLQIMSILVTRLTSDNFLSSFVLELFHSLITRGHQLIALITSLIG